MRLFRSLACIAVLITVATASPRSASAPTSFRVDVIGKGRPMILIPGLSSSGDTWKTTVARYQDRFQCHILTLAGFAGVAPIPQPLLATVRKELADYIRAERLQRPIIVGHSLGGTLALAVAVDNPGAVGPLVIVDALPFMAGAQMQVKTLEEAKASLAAMEAYFGNITQQQYDDYVKAGTATTFMVTKPADLELLKDWGMHSDRRTVGAALVDLMKIDLRADLGKVQAPTLVIGTWAGLHDQMEKYGTSLSRAAVLQTFEEQFATLTRLHFAMAATARHFVMFDDPAWFFQQLDAFLTDPDTAVRTRGFSEAR
jgi:pimeloyl-ACP methyl ester carboxylesterase